MTQRLQKALKDYLLYHHIEGSTEATVKFYAKELRLFLQDLQNIMRPARPWQMQNIDAACYPLYMSSST